MPETVSHDPDRLARFQREAELLASLSHPNIATLYGLEEAGGRPAIVMELIEGETLAARLSQSGGPQSYVASGFSRTGLPIDEALLIARQIAEALEAAHEHGVIHRDLKPANIKVQPDGRVKVLDFGLAKLAQASGLSASPTLSVHATGAGVILGTAAYMSPEQARGKDVDRRTDIWAFGCLLFEMLTGRQALATSGDTVSDAVAAILRAEPEWSALPADTPAALRRLLRRCLAKDPRERLHDVADARLDIEEALRAGAVFPRTAGRASAHQAGNRRAGESGSEFARAFARRPSACLCGDKRRGATPVGARIRSVGGAPACWHGRCQLPVLVA